MTGAKLILVVDDDADIRDAIREALEMEGYQVTVAVNGQQALNFLQSGPMPALILLDLMMPVMSGEQFVEKQRQDSALAQIPVVILSADGRIREKAASIHAAGYIHKPVTLDGLLAIARQYAG
jgi:two-component system chemotaxis response regulator CheY